MTSTASASLDASSSTTTPSPSSTESSYSFSINESTVRLTAIIVGCILGILLICALIAIEVMRRKIKRLNRECQIYALKLNGAANPNVGLNSGYASILMSAIEAQSPSELGNEREVVESDARTIEHRSWHR